MPVPKPAQISEIRALQLTQLSRTVSLGVPKSTWYLGCPDYKRLAVEVSRAFNFLQIYLGKFKDFSPRVETFPVQRLRLPESFGLWHERPQAAPQMKTRQGQDKGCHQPFLIQVRLVSA